MQNVHPIYNLKTLWVKRELAKDPKLADQDWSRFLPNFKKKNVKSKKRKRKEQYTPFPPENHQSARKVDAEIESGAYFVEEAMVPEWKRQKIAQTEKAERKAARVAKGGVSTQVGKKAKKDSRKKTKKKKKKKKKKAV